MFIHIEDTQEKHKIRKIRIINVLQHIYVKIQYNIHIFFQIDVKNYIICTHALFL